MDFLDHFAGHFCQCSFFLCTEVGTVSMDAQFNHKSTVPFTS